MDLLNKLPEELHFNIIKYLQHPLCVIFNKHIKVYEYSFDSTRYLNFINVRSPKTIYVRILEDVDKSILLDHKIKFTIHPTARILNDEIYKHIVDDDFISDDMHMHNEIETVS